MTPSMQAKEAGVDEIIRLHGEIIEAARTSLDKAIRLGELLTEQKSRLAHGQWLPWIKTTLPFSDRTARNYIRVYEQRERLKLETVSDLTDAYRQLAPPPDDELGNKTSDQLINEALSSFTRALDLLVIEIEHGISREDVDALHRALMAAATTTEKMLLASCARFSFSKLFSIQMILSEAASLINRKIDVRMSREELASFVK